MELYEIRRARHLQAQQRPRPVQEAGRVLTQTGASALGRPTAILATASASVAGPRVDLDFP
jgi:hypothetical protein